MKKLLTILITILLVSPSFAQTSGGPDAYGYVWYGSNNPNGPTFQWIDITAVGNLVTGLTDDNAVGPFPMGMNFHYYWSDYNQIKIGSNGWVSFNNPGNLAHCFPTIPTAGGAGDNILAPLMCDLNFSGAANPGQVYYYNDAANNRFIVSYINVPYWRNANPDYIGSSTFQIVLSAADSSITYNYLTTDAANFNNTPGCASDLVVGMENTTGNIGLQVYQDVVPASNYSIKFEYPHPVLFQIQDATPAWVLNDESKAAFFPLGGNIDFFAGIANKGNTTLSSQTLVSLQVRDLNNSVVYSQSANVPAGLAAGVVDTVSFSVPPQFPGQYSVRVVTANSGDINSSNNLLIAEMNVVNIFSNTFTLSYATQDDPDGSISWSGGGGGAIYVEPPIYPARLDSAAFFLGAATFNIANIGSFTVNVLAGDGPNGLPGTLLSSETVSFSGDPLNDWKNIALSTPVNVTTGGVYIGWNVNATDSLVVATETATPISRRTYEFVGGSWAPFRSGDNTEFLINGFFTNACFTFATSVASSTPVSCFGGSDGAISINVSGGSPAYSFAWSNGSTNEDLTGIPAGTYTVTITDASGCNATYSTTITEPAEIIATAVARDVFIANDGEIDLTVNGGTSPYSFLWDNGAGTGEDPDSLAAGTYTVVITDAKGCKDTLTVVVANRVGIEDDLLGSLISVYPNPNEGSFSVDAVNVKENILLEVLNTVGQRVYGQMISGGVITDIHLPQQSEGIYILRLTTESARTTRKLMLR
ncbi:MAG: T9SS type A sorting domain-containing protein [Bacteroidia bacterium]|nr:T9SS type A sorting domain-containing protein [Bacteroidia bacterium]